MNTKRYIRTIDTPLIRMYVIFVFSVIFTVIILWVDSGEALLSQLVLQLGTVVSDLSPEMVKP